MTIHSSSHRSSDRRPNLCKRRRADAGELYILKESWPFSLSFSHCSHPYIFLFNTFITSVGAHERIAKIRMSKFSILKFYETLKIAKIGSRMSFFLHSFFLLLRFQFYRFGFFKFCLTRLQIFYFFIRIPTF